MPPAVGLAIGGLAAAGGSAAGGKKGSNAASHAADQQYQIQQQQLQLANSLRAQANTVWQPAADYWSTLLKGDPTAVAQATGPMQEQIRQGYAGATNQIQSSLPQGGERNLALAQSQLGQASDMSRLYAGVQPTAAAALGQLAGLPAQLSATATQTGAPNVSAGLKYDRALSQQNSASAGSLGSGLGTLLYSSLNKGRAGKNAARTQTSVGAGGGYGQPAAGVGLGY